MRIKEDKEHMFQNLFQKFSEQKIAVIGDVMLDTYWFGSTDRISPEAPVPVVAVKKMEYRLGGAANVALNLLALNASVSIHSVVGNDTDADTLLQMFTNIGIDASHTLRSGNRLTTNKIRIVSRNQHLLRLDNEIQSDLDAETESVFIQATIDAFNKNKPDVVIFEDYNKGVLTENVISRLMNYCNENNIITAVDPKRKNFFSYRHAGIFKPNLKEVADALGILDIKPAFDGLTHIHQQLQKQLDHQVSLITLSEHGVFVADKNNSAIYPAHLRTIADVSGAGDTVIAVASLVYACTLDKDLTAKIANLAGGIVCEEVGTVAINAGKLLAECENTITI